MTIGRMDIRQGAARDSDVEAAGAYCQEASSNEQVVDNEVADHPWVPPFGEEDSSEGEGKKQ